MFYVLLLLLIAIFVYAKYLDKKKERKVTFDTISEYQDNFENKYTGLDMTCDKKRYHYKTGFVGITIKNVIPDKKVLLTDEYELSVFNKDDSKWYKLDIEPITDWSKKIILKKNDNYYQNIFLDGYILEDKDRLRIVKKFKIEGDEAEYIYSDEVSIHTARAIKK